MKANLNMESETKTYDLFIFYLVGFSLTSFYFPHILKTKKNNTTNSKTIAKGRPHYRDYRVPSRACNSYNTSKNKFPELSVGSMDKK